MLSLRSSRKPLSKLWMFISVVAGVFAAAGLFGWIMSRSARSMYQQLHASGLRSKKNSSPRRRVFS
jgi:hypothetical protein